MSSTDVIRIKGLNGRGDWDDCDEKMGWLRLSRETWMTEAIGETRITRVMR